jgi:hypothetical protein
MRPPSEAEVTRLIILYERALAKFQGEEAAAKQMATEPIGPLPTGVDAAQAAAMSVVANVILNLDEVLAKR